MSAPALQIYSNGGPGVSGDNLNTFEQTCDIVAQLRGFVGVSGLQVYLRGQTAVNDGYQGEFYWNANGTGTDDNGVTTVIPFGSVSGKGIWSRLTNLNNTYTYLVPTTGFNVVIGTGISSLILNPAATLASGVITMPSAPLNGQAIRISSTQNITSLTLSPASGQTILNAPTSLTAAVSVLFQYNLPLLTWFRLS